MEYLRAMTDYQNKIDGPENSDRASGSPVFSAQERRKARDVSSTKVPLLPARTSPQSRVSGGPLLPLELARFLRVRHVDVVVPQQAVLVLEFRVAQHALELRLLAALEPLVPLQRYHPPVLPAARVAWVSLKTHR